MKRQMCNCFESNAYKQQSLSDHCHREQQPWHGGCHLGHIQTPTAQLTGWSRQDHRAEQVFSPYSCKHYAKPILVTDMKVWRMKKVKVELNVRFVSECHLNMSVFELIIFILSPKPRDGIQNKSQFGILLDRQIMEIIHI